MMPHVLILVVLDDALVHKGELVNTSKTVSQSLLYWTMLQYVTAGGRELSNKLTQSLLCWTMYSTLFHLSVLQKAEFCLNPYYAGRCLVREYYNLLVGATLVSILIVLDDALVQLKELQL